MTEDELKERRELLKQRLESLWSEHPVWRNIDFGYGWDPILIDTLDELEDQNLAVVQLKEKFGAGRFYIEHSHDDKCRFKENLKSDCRWYHPSCDVERAIRNFEMATTYVCEDCSTYSLVTDDHGWWRNLCADCMQAFKALRASLNDELN